MRRLLAPVIAAGLAFHAVPVSPAHAAPPPTSAPRPAPSKPGTAASAPLVDSLQGPAKDAYLSAKILMNNGDASGAIAKYEQAYKLSKDPRLLFNMAVCARELHAYARMQKLLLQFESEMGTSITAEDKSNVEAALAAIHNFVGKVTLTITPADAPVTIDGEPVTQVPGEPLVLGLGKHTLVVSKPGFQTLTRALAVEGGGETSEAVTLAPETHAAHLEVHAQGDAVVRVDDGKAAVGGYSGALASGTHEVVVTAPGKRDFRAQVALRDDETRSLDVTLEDEHHGSPVWPWIVGGAAVVAGAVVGGYFLFKPSDTTVPIPKGDQQITISSWRVR